MALSAHSRCLPWTLRWTLEGAHLNNELCCGRWSVLDAGLFRTAASQSRGSKILRSILAIVACKSAARDLPEDVHLVDLQTDQSNRAPHLSLPHLRALSSHPVEHALVLRTYAYTLSVKKFSNM